MTISELNVMHLVKHLALTALALSGAGAQPTARTYRTERRNRSSCPRWPEADGFEPSGTDACDGSRGFRARLESRLRQDGDWSEIRRDCAVVDREPCIPDASTFKACTVLRLSAPPPQIWHYDFWRPEGYARVYGGDTLILPRLLPRRKKYLAAHLRHLTDPLWRQQRIVFCGKTHSYASQSQVAQWAGGGEMRADVITLTEGLPASFEALMAENSYVNDGTFYRDASAPWVRLFGLEDPRIKTISALAQYYHSPSQTPPWELLLILRNFLQPDPSMLPLWQSSFASSASRGGSAGQMFLSLEPATRIEGMRRFVADVANALEADDKEAADATRCLFALPREDLRWKALHITLVDEARTRGWAHHIGQMTRRFPDAPFFVLAGAAHIPDLRAILSQKNLTEWAAPTGEAEGSEVRKEDPDHSLYDEEIRRL